MSRIEEEKEVLNTMISIYCKHNHRSNALCSECSSLQEYVNNKLDKCYYQENKRFCASCDHYCFQGEQQAKIREVMRYSRFKIIFSNPILVIKHALTAIKYGKKE